LDRRLYPSPHWQGVAGGDPGLAGLDSISEGRIEVHAVLALDREIRHHATRIGELLGRDRGS